MIEILNICKVDKFMFNTKITFNRELYDKIVKAVYITLHFYVCYIHWLVLYIHSFAAYITLTSC